MHRESFHPYGSFLEMLFGKQDFWCEKKFLHLCRIVNLALNTTITTLTPHFLLLSVLITVITNRASCECWLEFCYLGEKLVKHQYTVFQHIYASGHVIGKIRKRHCRRVMHVLFLSLLLCINHIKNNITVKKIWKMWGKVCTWWLETVHLFLRWSHLLH